MSRGFAMVGLHNPKMAENVGGALRAAFCYEAAGVIIDGPRRKKFIDHKTDTMKAYRTVPTWWVDDLLESIPHDCVPVAVDLIPGAVPLPFYRHPERALYIFGAEDATLGDAITRRCRETVYVPTRLCMNLAATVNVVLFDRLSKAQQRSLLP